jgi:tetratricopeptide (TPR) repeat protein
MHLFRALFLSAGLVVAGTSIAADPPAEAEKIKIPLPWKQGQVLHYQVEQVETDTSPGSREKSISTSMIEVKTMAAGKDGFVQHWRGYDNKHEVLEGDKEQAKAIVDAMKGLEDLAFVIEMDGEGSYKGMRNLQDVTTRLRAAMQPVMLKLVRDATTKATATMEPTKRREAMDKVEAETNAVLDRFTAPQVLEGMLTRDIQTVLNFTGAELEDDQSYELETTLENPTGGAPFPAKLTFGLYVDKDAPEDIWLEWTLEIDPVKGAVAIWETAERLFGREIGEAERKTLPLQVSIVDKGFIVFERATGVPEMYQYVRNAKIAENANYERRRMRLVEQAHDHEWSEETPHATEPELSAEERDAQLCADDAADIVAAIAACSRELERKDLEPAKRAAWHGQRGWHRYRNEQGAEGVADFDKAMALDPANAGYVLGRSRAHRQVGDFAAALVDADRTLAMEPTWSHAQVARGAAFEGMGKWGDAVAAYDKAITIAPDNPTWHDARCWARAMTGAYAGGKEDCDRALALDPESWNSYNSRGYIHYRLGNHAAAVADYDKAIEHVPGMASSWYIRGLAKRALGDAKGADADVAKGLELDPKVAERYAGYGVK